MRLVFMGSSDASAITLRALLRVPQWEIAGIVTQPDRPSGRRQHLTPCPCKAFATEHGFSTIISPEKVNAPEVIEQIAQLRPDLIIVVAFGQFLGNRLLTLPPLGCINGHFSLLPKYRGAAPVQASIASGDKEAGVTIMQMAAGMDDGDMLLKAIEPICSDDTGVTLMERLAILNAVAMVKALRLLLAGTLTRQPQDPAQVSFSPKMLKSDGLIDWRQPARVIERLTRAYQPWPGAFTYLPTRLSKTGAPERIKVLQAEVLPDNPEAAEPGTVIQLSPDGPIIATGDSPLCLKAVQPDGSRRMDGKSFLNGHPLIPGDKLGNGEAASE